MAKDPIHISTVVKATKFDLHRHTGRCPIANTLALSDPGEILFPRAKGVFDKKGKMVAVRIVFSRRSTNMRYEYLSKLAVRFLDKWDRGLIPGSFRLVLKESNLIKSSPRSKVDPSIRRRKVKKQKAPRTSRSARPLPTKPISSLKKAA